MNTLCILDLETTSPDPRTAQIVEIACALWSVPHRTLTSVYSTVVHVADNPAESINGISAAATEGAPDVERAMATVERFAAKADVIVAHNGETFDREFLRRERSPLSTARPWLDTMDVDWPRAGGSRSLLALAASHGVPIGTVHRAMDDVLLLARLLERVAETADLETLLVRAMRPKVLVEALTPRPWDMQSGEWAELKETLVASGFRFDSAAKRWAKRMPEEDVAALPFDARVVDANEPAGAIGQSVKA